MGFSSDHLKGNFILKINVLTIIGIFYRHKLNQLDALGPPAFLLWFCQVNPTIIRRR